MSQSPLSLPLIFESTFQIRVDNSRFLRSLDAHGGSFGFAFDFSMSTSTDNVTDVGRDYNKVTS